MYLFQKYRISYLFFHPEVELPVYRIAETFNGLMAIPNLIAVFLLSGVVVKLVKEYFAGEGKNA